VTLWLASTSPRRRQLLRRLGMSFRIIPPLASEADVLRRNRHLSPRQFARECARAKALSVSDRVRSGLVIGVDTIVVLGDRIMGKPKHRADARAMLRALSGRTHEVVSGVAVVRRPGAKVRSAAESTRVTFRRLGDAEIDRYVATREPYDKAGAYAIQEQAGIFVSRVVGCYLNVIGLPVPLLQRLLKESGWRPTASR
jgi:septum formation protein